MGTSISPVGAYAGYLLMESGNVWVAACFFLLATISTLLVLTTLCRYIINYRRIMRMNRLQPNTAFHLVP